MSRKSSTLVAIPLSILCSILVLFTSPNPANAASFGRVIYAQNEITLDQAVNMIRQQTGGRILSARRHNAAEPVYVIKVLLTTGQIKVYRVSVETGEIK